MTKNSTKIIEGNWDKLKGKIKKEWGKLSDDDITQIEGSYDKLVGKIKKAYGQTDDKVIEQIQSFLEDSDLKNVKNKAQDEAESLWGAAKDIKDKVEKSLLNSLENIKTTSLSMEEDIVTYIKNNPVKSVIFTTLAGALFAKFYFNKKK